MRVVSSLEMRELENKAESLGISKLLLMENAGRSVFCEVQKIINEKRLKEPKILIICGKGNNGGDGFVTARFFLNHGYKIRVVFLGESDKLSPESLVNYKILSSYLNSNGSLFLNKILVSKIEIPKYPPLADYDISDMSELVDKLKYEDFSDEFKYEVLTSDIIIDAIFGTGLTRDITGYLEKIIDFINRNKKYVVSIDIPSGIDSDNGSVRNIAIKADTTVALGFYKLGHLLGEGRDYSGKLVLGDISLPKYFEMDSQYHLLTEQEVKKILKKRVRESHKGSYGHVVVLGGVKGMSGAPLMTSVSAIKSGCGLVSAIIPDDISLAFQNLNPEIMTYPVKSFIDEEEKILEFVNSKDALVIGNGLGTKEETKKFFRSFICKLKIPVVIDADGLNILSEFPDILKEVKTPVVLTPHIGEMVRISRKEKREITSSPHLIASHFAKLYGVYIVLKSSSTIIAEPDGKTYFSIYGNPGMATAGSGDVLAGIIGSFIAQGYNLLDALSLALVVHGLAGDMAKKRSGENALTATDIIKNISKILKKWEEK